MQNILYTAVVSSLQTCSAILFAAECSSHFPRTSKYLSKQPDKKRPNKILNLSEITLECCDITLSVTSV